MTMHFTYDYTKDNKVYYSNQGNRYVMVKDRLRDNFHFFAAGDNYKNIQRAIPLSIIDSIDFPAGGSNTDIALINFLNGKVIREQD